MLKDINILVAEDNRLNQKIAKFILEKQNANITLALNGNEAIEQLQRNNFDVILMDLQMPELDGYETTRFIRQNMKNSIPIIALSASNLEDDVQRCLEAGMNACTFKPFDPNNLCALILKLLKEHKVTP